MSYQKRIVLLSLVDAAIISLAVIFAYLLRFDFYVEYRYLKLVPYVIFANIILILITFNWVNMYRRMWQYASIGELLALVKAITISQVIFGAFHMTVQHFFPKLIVPRSIYLLSWVLIILGVGGSRLGWRMFRDSYTKLDSRTGYRRTLIVGAGGAGVLIARELKQSADSHLYPVAFIDDDPGKWKLEILGLPVLGGREHIPQIVENHSIQKIIIAIPSASRSETAKIIEICKNTKAKVKILPRVADLISRRVSVNMIREVGVEDLLGRDPVEVDLNEIAAYVTGRVVLVTGAGGSIGSELCRQVSRFSPARLLLLGQGENSIYDIENELKRSIPGLALETIIADVKDRRRIAEVFEKYRPELVFHAAAHKHVPLMERNPAEAVKNNVLGTKNVAECAHEYGAARFVMISTDKAVNPTSVMGVSKRVAEMFVRGLALASSTKFVAVRFGNVLGSRGSVIPLFKRQIREGGPVTVTHPEMVRYFMTIPEAVQLVIQAGAFAKGGEVFILDMGNPVKISDLARDLIRLSGLEPGRDIQITYTGIRPGEKLYEEIMTNEEGISATRHNRIFVGKPGDFSWDELQFMIRKLEQVATRGDVSGRVAEIKELFKQIVPTYTPDSDTIRPVSPTKEVVKQSPALSGLAEQELAVGHLDVTAREIATSK